MALQINGRLVVIPHLGTVVESVQGTVVSFQRLLANLFGFSIFLGVQGFVYLLFVVSIVGYAVGAWRDREAKERRRTQFRNTGYSAYVLVAGLTALIVIAVTASMIAPAGVQKYGVVSAEFDSPGPRVIPTGESEVTTYPVGNAGIVPVVVFLEPASEGIEIQPREVRVDRWSVVNTTVTLSAPPETGYYRRFLVEHRYLAILPPSTIRTLYHVHPWLPIAVINALVGVPFYVLGVALVGTGRIRSRSRPDKPTRTKRLLNRFT